MIDIHCHILPDIDDGAKDMAQSLSMARMALAGGTEAIIATPHFRGEETSLNRLPLILNRYQSLCRALEKDGIPLTLYPGGEILCLPQTPRLGKQGMLPTLGNTDYLLCEFYFNESPVYMDEMLRTLASYGYRIAVAHPERYHALQRDPSLAQQWFRRGWVLQLNKGSLLGAFGPRVQQTASRMLQYGLVHLFASDAHGTQQRTTDMRALRRALEDRCPQTYIRVMLEENPRRLLAGLDMVKPERDFSPL